MLTDPVVVEQAVAITEIDPLRNEIHPEFDGTKARE
jgi:hypothetical protein